MGLAMLLPGISRAARVPVEFRLVLLSAAGGWADDAIRRLLKGSVRWPLVQGMALREQATSVLRRRLEDIGADVPDEVRDGMRRAGMVEEFRMEQLERRLGEVVRLLEGEGIDVLLLKGAAIALEGLDGFRDRPMGDVDLLVRPDQAAFVQSLVRGENWSPLASGHTAEMYRDLHHLIPLRARDGLGFGLEVHVDLFPAWHPFRFAAAEVWRDARPLSLARRPAQGHADGEGRARADAGPAKRPTVRVLVPSFEHQFIHTTLHFAWSHQFSRGIWRMVRDMDLLLSDPRLDAASLAGALSASRGSSCAYWTLVLLGELTGRDVPETLMKRLEPPTHPLLRRPVLRQLIHDTLIRVRDPGTRTLSRVLWTLAIAPGRSMHGESRPWIGAERWPEAREHTPVSAGPEPEPGWFLRVRGAVSHAARLLGLTPARF